MCEGHGSNFMSVSVCVCVCMCMYVCVCLLPCYSSDILVYMFKVRVSCRLSKVCIVWTSLKMFRDMELFVCYNDQRHFFFDKKTPMVLDTIKSGTVYEPLAGSDDYLH